jgi:hypothetical protein
MAIQLIGWSWLSHGQELKLLVTRIIIMMMTGSNTSHFQIPMIHVMTIYIKEVQHI